MSICGGNGRLLFIYILLILMDVLLSFSTPKFSHKVSHIMQGAYQTDSVPSTTIQHDLWIVGSGTLGITILSKLQNNPRYANIVAETQSETRREEIHRIGGIEHRLRNKRSVADKSSARNVIICLPPSCSASYTDEIYEATSLWAGKAGGGSLIYTSSIGVYGEAAGSIVTEDYPTDSTSPSATRLAAAENVVLTHGGNAIRLAGLYSETRGPHAYWLHKSRDAVMANSSVPVLPGSALALVNMLHYDDAAEAVVAVLAKTDLSGRVFLAVDNEPISREEICRSAMASGLYPDCPMPQFTTREPSTSKVCDGTQTRRLLGWEPRYASFRAHMRGLGDRKMEQDVPAH